VTALEDEVIVTITEKSGTELYDGTVKTVTGYEVTSISNPLYKEAYFSFSGDASVSGKNAGTYDMELKPADFTNNNTNFANVKFVIVDGTLTITKRQVTLTSATDSKVYDGTALKNDTVTVTGDGFATGEGATYNVTGSQTDVGTSNNTFTYILDEGTLADNYDIKTVEGKLTVTALEDEVIVTITEKSGTELYDGTVKTVTGYEVTSISNPLYKEAYFSFSGDASVSGKNAGTYNMELKPADFTNNNTNFANVTFVIVDGTLEITKRQVTLTSATASKIYDGTALTKDEVTVGGDGFAAGEGATYNVTGSQTDVGTSDNAFTYTLDEGTLAANYDITKTEGKLTVTALEDEVIVTITENSGTYTYDGTEKTVTGYTVTSISNPLYKEADFSFSGTDSVSGKNAGTYNMELKPEDFTNNNTNFANVKFVIVDGTLEITKRQVTLTSATASKIYDGTALTKDEVTVGGDGFATGEGASYNVTGSQTDVGTSNNTFTYTLDEGTNAANYDIKIVEGKLTVTALEDELIVTITENSGSYTYDGTVKTVTGYTVTSISNPLYKASYFSFSGDASVSGTNAGTYNMELEPGDFTNNNTNFANVTFVIVDGTLTVEPKAVTITTGSAEKEYDGTALTDAIVIIDGLVYGETVTVTATGSQTEVGSSANTYEIEWDNAMASNYTVTDNLGTLTVTAAEPDPTEPDPTEPDPTEPDPTEPDPTEPDPTEPEPTEPEPTEPEPTEPEPTEPEPTIIIPDPETPLAGGKSWALLNLLLTILTGIIMLVLWIGYFTSKKREDEDEETETVESETGDEDEDKDSLKRKGILRLLSLIPFVVAVIVFILTEDMRNPMVFVDRWTILMAAIALVQAVLALFCKKSYKEEEEEQEEEATA
jgi:F0F1-type ATP synthase epsilon subunit